MPKYFEHVFTYIGDNHALQGFLNAMVLVMQTGFAVTAAVCMLLNLVLAPEAEDIGGSEDSAAESKPGARDDEDWPNA